MIKRINVWDIDIPIKDKQAIGLLVGLIDIDIPVDKVYLFGSKARGDYNEDSDTDILILITEDSLDNGMKRKIREIIAIININLDCHLGSVIVDSYNWDNNIEINILLKNNIEREGILIYC